jgi:SAM-dependent methyltransferase
MSIMHKSPINTTFGILHASRGYEDSPLSTDLDFSGENAIPGKTPDRIMNDHLERYRFAAKYVQNRRVLDIACGVGYGSKILADAGASSVDGVDINSRTIGYARSRYPHPQVHFLTGDVLDYRANVPYDVITSFETIEHIDLHLAALDNFHKLLAKDGLLIVSTPNRRITSPNCGAIDDRPENRFHVREFLLEELLRSLIQKGFSPHKPYYGQRQGRFFKAKFLQDLYNRYFNPSETTSPKVSPIIRFRQPRYVVVVAKKLD